MKKIIITSALAVMLVVGIIITAISCTVIPTGSVGVQTTFGKVQEDVLESGLHWKGLTTKAHKVSVANTTKEIETQAFSKDIQEVSLKITVVYCVSKENAKTIHVNYGKRLFEEVTQPTVLSEVKTVISQYTAQELVENRGVLGERCLAQLQALKSPATFVGINITDIDFSDAYTNAIEAKQVSEQELLAQKTKNEIALQKATNEAELKRINAEGEATALLAKAKAEAEANGILQESITDIILQKLALDKWDGKLPLYGSDPISGLILGSAN